MAFHNPEMCVSRDAGSFVRQTFSALGAIGLFSLLSGTNNGLFAHWPSASGRPGGPQLRLYKAITVRTPTLKNGVPGALPESFVRAAGPRARGALLHVNKLKHTVRFKSELLSKWLILRRERRDELQKIQVPLSPPVIRLPSYEKRREDVAE